MISVLMVLLATGSSVHAAEEVGRSLSPDGEQVTLTHDNELYTLKLGPKKVCFFVSRHDGYGVSAPVCLDDGKLVPSGKSAE